MPPVNLCWEVGLPGHKRIPHFCTVAESDTELLQHLVHALTAKRLDLIHVSL